MKEPIETNHVNQVATAVGRLSDEAFATAVRVIRASAVMRAAEICAMYGIPFDPGI